ncbi:hypothetical protein FO519_002483 [Halicephalobus sp. NKZ332]|nr:hypothetical protein FO519_002483 [Halicephalobus sp. NKZ332]
MAQGNNRNRPVPSIRQPLLYEESRMSKDRQKFLIICIFDFAFATLLWLLSTVTKGDDWPTIFINEINIFEPHFLSTSLFDIVIVCFLRMTVLLTCFAWLRLNHWLPVAVTTTVTTLYVIIKVLFFFNKHNGALPQYLTILAAFINAWVELWLLPFRVLAQERRHDEASIESPPTETTIVRNEDQVPRIVPSTSQTHLILNPGAKKECLQVSLSVESKAKELITDIMNWKQLNSNPEIRYSDKLNSYYVRKEFNCSAKSLYEASWKDNTLWNNQVKNAFVLNTIDISTELVRIVSQPAMNGYIASREFIDVRRVTHDKKEDIYFCTYASIGPSISRRIPLTDGLVRGENGTNVVRVMPSESSGFAVFEFIMNTDVKGKIPKMAIRSTTKSFLVNYVDSLEKFINQNRAKYT